MNVAPAAPEAITAALAEAALDYIGRGFALTWLPYGEKFPNHPGWNGPDKVVTTPEQARAKWNGTPRNIGLVHGLGKVKTCSLDVDDERNARLALADVGLDLDALTVAAPCCVGKNPRFVYVQPPGADLELVRLQWPDPTDPKRKTTIFELRAGANQDALPPSKHPSGKPYEWRHPLPADPADHPTPPPALLDLWTNWAKWEPLLQAACPWSEPVKPKPAPRSQEAGAHPDVIGAFNRAHDVRQILEEHGYRPRGKTRYLPPDSSSGVPSVRILDSGAYSDNGSCPLNDGRPHDAFDCFRILEHRGDVRAAIKAAAALLGIERTGREVPQSGIDPILADRCGIGPEPTRAVEVLVLQRGQDLKPAPIDWLWPGWLARGKVHVMAGPPGAGKTTLGIAMCATLTCGGRWPSGETVAPCNAVVWSGEDDPTDTLVPRLMACGADMSRIYFVDRVLSRDGKRAFDPAQDMSLLLDRITAIGDVGMVMIDPLVSAVTGDSHKNSEVRRSLQPLVDLAMVTRAACLGITHFNKGSAGKDPVERVVGSIAFGALARVVMAATKVSEEQGGGRILVRAKSNIGTDHGGFKYELRQGELSGHPDITASWAEWGAAVQGEARELLDAAEVAADPEERGAREEAKDFLRVLLADGPVPAKEVKRQADENGHCWRTINTAKKDIGIVTEKIGGHFAKSTQQWVWKLPNDLKNASSFEECRRKHVGKTLHSSESLHSSVDPNPEKTDCNNVENQASGADRAAFLALLRDGGAGDSSAQLCQKLKWDRARFDAVKADLIGSREIWFDANGWQIMGGKA